MSDSEELPEGWATASLDMLLEPGGLFDGPFGSSLKTSDYTESGVRVIRLENVSCLQFIGEKKTFISPDKYETLKRHTVREGDIIVGSFVDGPVRVCLLPPLDTLAIAKADCFCVRPRSDMIDPRYLVYQLGALRTQEALIEDVHGATRPRITTKQLRTFTVLLCPMNEQRRIVDAIDAVFATLSDARNRLGRAAAILGCELVHKPGTGLLQALLAKAFRAELVPTEAELARRESRTYEPASELLTRLRTSTNGEPKGTKTRKSSKRATASDDGLLEFTET